MKIEQRKPRIGVLALMQDIYDQAQPEITTELQDFVEKVLERIQGTAEYVFPGLAKNRTTIEQFVREFQYQELDGIFLVNTMYSPGLRLVQAMKKNTLPVLLANIQPLPAVTEAWDWHALTINHGIHGIQDTANMLLRLGEHPAIITEDWQSEIFAAKVADWAKAAAAVQGLTHLRVACMEKMKNMGDILGDEVAYFQTFGLEVLHEGVGGIFACMEKIAEEEVDALVAENAKVYEIDPTLPEESHRYAARLQLGLEAFCEERGYDGFSANFDAFSEDGRFRQLPLLAASNMMAKGYAYAAEGDVHVLLLVALGQLLTGRPHFTEMYSLDYEKDACLFAHMGEGNPKAARKDRSIRLIDRPLEIGNLENPPTPVFSVEPGEATVVSLAPLSGKSYRLLAMKGEVLDEAERLAIPMNYSFFRPDNGIRTATDRWLQAGGTHHEVLLPGDQIAVLQHIAQIWGIGFEQIS